MTVDPTCIQVLMNISPIAEGQILGIHHPVIAIIAIMLGSLSSIIRT